MLKHAYQTGTANNPASEVSATRWNEGHVIDTGGVTLPAHATTPATPAADNVVVFSRTLAGRTMPVAMGPSGMDYALQPSIWRQKIGFWNAAGNSATVPGVYGLPALTAVGTNTARNVATTNLFTRTRRIGLVSAATAGSLASRRLAAAQVTVGNGAGLGGFFFSTRFGISDAAAVAGARFFTGVTSATGAPTNVEPSTLTNSIGLAQLSTSSTQLYIVYGGSAAQTAIALGTDFPPMNGTGVTNGVFYDFSLFSSPSVNGVVHYRLERVGTAFVATGTLGPGTAGTTLPANTTLLAFNMWRSNNATALAVGFDVSTFYLETDY